MHIRKIIYLVLKSFSTLSCNSIANGPCISNTKSLIYMPVHDATVW